MRTAAAVLAGAVLVAAACVAAGGEKDVDFSVRVTGTEGLAFTGFYELVLVDTVRTRKDISGKVPATFDFTGDTITFRVAKEGPGTLKLEIVRNGEVYDDEESSAPGYAQLSVSHDF